MAYNGFNRPTLQEITTRLITNVNNNLPGQDASVRFTALNAIVTALAGALHEEYGQLSWGLRQTNLIECEDENLDGFGGQTFGVLRKQAAYATGSVTFTGTNGNVVPSGSLLQSATGLQYKTTTSATISSGSATANITAVLPGINYNLSPGALLTLATPISNVNSTSTVISLVGGAEIENDDNYRLRILSRIRQASHGGNYNDYITWALEVPGVTRAWVTPLARGVGTVDVRFAMDNTYTNGIPMPADVAIVQAYLDSDDRRPITADVKVLAPAAVALNITITGLSPNNSTVQANILAELQDTFASKSEPGVTFRNSWIWDAISNADGVNYFMLTSPSSDQIYSAGYMPVLGTVTFV